VEGLLLSTESTGSSLLNLKRKLPARPRQVTTVGSFPDALVAPPGPPRRSGPTGPSHGRQSTTILVAAPASADRHGGPHWHLAVAPRRSPAPGGPACQREPWGFNFNGELTTASEPEPRPGLRGLDVRLERRADWARSLGARVRSQPNSESQPASEVGEAQWASRVTSRSWRAPVCTPGPGPLARRTGSRSRGRSPSRLGWLWAEQLAELG
jgi:hypothetical protein